MKAVSVLLCLALAHGITANIFRQQDRPVDDLEVQQLNYIDQYQRQHRNQPSQEETRRGEQGYLQAEKQRNQVQRNQERDQAYQQQRDQQRQQQSGYQQDQHYQTRAQRDQNQQAQNQEWEQPQNTQPREQSMYSHQQQYQQYQKPTQHRVQYQPSTQQSQEHNGQYSNSHSQAYSQHSQSSSSESRSAESQERRQYNNGERPMSQTHNQQWHSSQEDSVMNRENMNVPAYNDEISWSGLQMVQQIQDNTVEKNDDIEKIFDNAKKAMKHITEEDKVKFHQAYDAAKQQGNEDTELNATQLAQKYEYPIEEHTIQTDDGYVLTLFRIPSMKQNIRDVQKRPVVFLMHGILGSADDWLLMGPGKSLAYLLSDAGYDVWLGNARGNKYSRRHVSKHPAVSDFWQYSTDEIALHDLPAMIDYALQTTQQEKLYYIGHAQGTTAFFALSATRPEYNDKIIMMYALSPMVYMTNVRSPLFRMIAPTYKYHAKLQQVLGNGAFTPKKELIRAVGGDMLEKEIGCQKVSSNVNFVMAGVDVDGLDANLIPVVMRHLPAGTSTKVIKHYAQGVASEEFRKYDHGAKINQKVYGNEQPPKYEMEKVQAPVTLYYSEEDWLAHPKDVERLEKELPNVRETHKVSDEHFSHMDFQFSTKALEHVYRRLIESMQNNQ